MERDEEGRILLSETDTATVRAALFVAVHHPDEVVGHCEGCFQTITGVERSAFPALLGELDELSGRNERLDQDITAELERLASWDDEKLAAATFLPDLLRHADERGLAVPARLRDRG